VVSFLQAFSQKPCTFFCPVTCVPRAPPTSSSLTWSAELYLEMSTNYEAPHCASSINLL
jgi:hypothetical protein